MKTIFKKVFKYLLLIILTIILFQFAVNFFSNKPNPYEVRYDEDYKGVIQESQYVISKQMILSNLQTNSQIVSYQQDLHKVETHIDNSWLGTRKTELEVKGTYKMGLNTKDILVKHIDSVEGIDYLKLPKPIVISLDIPYEQITFEKKGSFFRMEMNEDEKKKFYSSMIDNIHNELSNDENILEHAKVFNEKVIEDILTSMTGVKSVVFTYE